jgi:hypothetical protein
MSEARGSGSWLAVAMDERPPAEQEPQPVGPVKQEPIPGFYAGTSRGEPPSTRGRRQGALLVGAIVTVAAGAALVMALGKGDDEPAAATPEPEPTPVATTGPTPVASTSETSVTAPPPPPASDVPASEVVEIVEEGWYVPDESIGSYGFVVENTSDRLLGSFVVRVKAYDLSDHVISGLDTWKHVVGTMLPRQRIAIADRLHPEARAAGGIGRLEFSIAELSEDTAEGAGSSEVPQGSVQVGEIGRTTNTVRTTVSYAVTSSYDIALDANAYVVFRDAAGEIVGGASSFVDLPAGATTIGNFDLPADVVSPAAASMEVHVVPRLPL